MNLTVTAVVPTYNRSDYIIESLLSLLNQTTPPSRIIVVDDGSTDDTSHKLEQFGDAIEYVFQENCGKASALNRALDMITGGLVWIFDDDDVACEGALEMMTSAFKIHPTAGFVYGRNDVFGIDDDGARFHYSIQPPAVLPETLFGALLERSFIHQGAMLVRKSCYEETGPFDTALVRSQDYDMILRLAHRYPGYFVDEILYSQRKHNGMRGTRNVPVQASDVEDAWLRYDQLIIRKLEPTLNLSDYLPRGRLYQMVPAEVFKARLKRFVIFVRKNMQDLATTEFVACASLANEIGLEDIAVDDKALLERALDEHSRGLRGFYTSTVIKQIARLFKSHSVRTSIRRALSRPLPFVLRAAIRNRSFDQGKLTFTIMCQLCGRNNALFSLARIGVGFLIGQISGHNDYESSKSRRIAESSTYN